MGHGSQWETEEDDILASMWLEISGDAVVGAYQKKDTFWERVSEGFKEAYKKKTGSESGRSANAIKNRWQAMNRSVQKLNGLYSALKAAPKSGWNDEKYYEEACNAFQAEMKAPFTHKSVWERLRKEPKWKSGYCRDESLVAAAIAAKKKKQELRAIQEKENEFTIDEEEELDDDGEEDERPVGNKMEKKKRRKEASESWTQLDVDKEMARAASARAAVMGGELIFKIIALDANTQGGHQSTLEGARRWLELKVKKAMMREEAEEAVPAMEKTKENKTVRRSSFQTPRSESETPSTCPELSSFPSGSEISDESGDVTWAPPMLCCSKELCSFYDADAKQIVTSISCRARCDVCTEFCHRRCISHRGEDSMVCQQCYYN